MMLMLWRLVIFFTVRMVICISDATTITHDVSRREEVEIAKALYF